MPEAVENRFRELAAQYGLDYDAMCVKDNTNCQWWNTNVNAISFLEEKKHHKRISTILFFIMLLAMPFEYLRDKH